jgi:hypothetical protein
MDIVNEVRLEKIKVMLRTCERKVLRIAHGPVTGRGGSGIRTIQEVGEFDKITNLAACIIGEPS